MLTNVHDVPGEGKFCYDGGRAIKTQTVVDYDRHMGCVDKRDRIENLRLI
jgi:hypothetical protein